MFVLVVNLSTMNAQTYMEGILLNGKCSTEEVIYGYFSGGMPDLCPYLTFNNHDLFGKRSIDLMSDIWSGDVALKKCNYGWNSSDGQLNLSNRRYELWFYYYRWLYSVNRNIVEIQSRSSFDNIEYAQSLAYRGYIYSCLANLYGNYNDESLCCPIYTEDNYTVRFDHFSTRKEVFEQAIKDLEQSVTIFEQDAPDYGRSSKFDINHEVACGLLAYAYLNAAVGSQQQSVYLQKALVNARKVIDSHIYVILPQDELTTNGFNNVESANWMWGMDNDSLTTGNLKSFWGSVDVFTYSYAVAGDVKAIDANLHASIPAWDARKNWFLSSDVESEIPDYKRTTYALAPVNKFFSAINHSTVDISSIKREWLSDDVYMRIESMYLIAAEAAYRNGDEVAAVSYLQQLCNERVLEGKETELSSWLSSLSGEALKDAIIYNWRVEMWGEGYGYETMRRWQHARVRGSNHLWYSSEPVTTQDITTKLVMAYPYLLDSLDNEILDEKGNKVLLITGEEITITFASNLCDHYAHSFTAMAGDYVWFEIMDESLPDDFSYWEVQFENDAPFIVEDQDLVLWPRYNVSVTAHFGESEGIDQTSINHENSSKKILKDGQILIHSGDKTYTLQGQEVK